MTFKETLVLMTATDSTYKTLLQHVLPNVSKANS